MFENGIKTIMHPPNTPHTSLRSHIIRDEQWFMDWFNNHFYMTVYRHRSQQDADRAVALLLKTLPADMMQAAGAVRVLDVCCGGGRHLRALADAGLQVAGLDLSATLLALAREALGHHQAMLYQCDMREPYPGGLYECVTNFFTSFGYFSDHEENCLVLSRVREVLKPDGWFFFDFLNAHAIAEMLIPEDTQIVEDMTVVQKRRIDAGFVKKDITVIDERHVQHNFTEQVRLYTLNELEWMFTSAGLSIRATFGNYDGSPFTKASPRLILAAQRF
jgi:SAM-dependent methyltransferase